MAEGSPSTGSDIRNATARPPLGRDARWATEEWERPPLHSSSGPERPTGTSDDANDTDHLLQVVTLMRHTALYQPAVSRTHRYITPGAKEALSVRGDQAANAVTAGITVRAPPGQCYRPGSRHTAKLGQTPNQHPAHWVSGIMPAGAAREP